MWWSVITKCDSFFITKCDKCYYKVRQVLQSVTILLQSVTILLQSLTISLQSLTNLLQSATGTKKCNDYYKVQQYRVSQEALSSPLTAILQTHYTLVTTISNILSANNYLNRRPVVSCADRECNLLDFLLVSWTSRRSPSKMVFKNTFNVAKRLWGYCGIPRHILSKSEGSDWLVHIFYGAFW